MVISSLNFVTDRKQLSKLAAS